VGSFRFDTENTPIIEVWFRFVLISLPLLVPDIQVDHDQGGQPEGVPDIQVDHDQGGHPEDVPDIQVDHDQGGQPEGDPA
jgi:hypothetical protein